MTGLKVHHSRWHCRATIRPRQRLNKAWTKANTLSQLWWAARSQADSVEAPQLQMRSEVCVSAMWGPAMSQSNSHLNKAASIELQARSEAKQRKAVRQSGEASSSDFPQISGCYAAIQVSLSYNKRTDISNLRVAGGGSYRQSRSARCGATRSATRQPAADSKQHTTSCNIQASRWNKITIMKTTGGTARDKTIFAAGSLPATKRRRK